MRYSELFNLKANVAVVTGGAGLIGKEIVRGLAEAQATVILADINKNRSKAAVKRFADSGLDVMFCHIDITDQKSVLELINIINRKYKRIDIWVNSAYPRTTDWNRKFESIPSASWRKNVDMHLNGYFICCQKIAGYMKKKKHGSIINIGSIYGIVGPDFDIYKNTKMTVPGAYSAIKGGIINFTRYLASYYGKYNIRVNCISPGGIYNEQPKEFVKRYTEKTPLGRMAKEQDIVGAVIYLASDASKYVTGHNLVVDGGWSII